MIGQPRIDTLLKIEAHTTFQAKMVKCFWNITSLTVDKDSSEQRDLSELGNEFDSFEMADLPFSIDDVDVNEMNLNASNSTSIQEQPSATRAFHDSSKR